MSQTGCKISPLKVITSEQRLCENKITTYASPFKKQPLKGMKTMRSLSPRLKLNPEKQLSSPRKIDQSSVCKLENGPQIQPKTRILIYSPQKQQNQILPQKSQQSLQQQEKQQFYQRGSYNQQSNIIQVETLYNSEIKKLFDKQRPSVQSERFITFKENSKVSNYDQILYQLKILNGEANTNQFISASNKQQLLKVFEDQAQMEIYMKMFNINLSSSNNISQQILNQNTTLLQNLIKMIYQHVDYIKKLKSDIQLEKKEKIIIQKQCDKLKDNKFLLHVDKSELINLQQEFNTLENQYYKLQTQYNDIIQFNKDIVINQYVINEEEIGHIFQELSQCIHSKKQDNHEKLESIFQLTKNKIPKFIEQQRLIEGQAKNLKEQVELNSKYYSKISKNFGKVQIQKEILYSNIDHIQKISEIFSKITGFKPLQVDQQMNIQKLFSVYTDQLFNCIKSYKPK